MKRKVMKRAQFSNFEIGITCGGIVMFCWKGEDVAGVIGKFTETDGNIELFINGVSYGEHTLSGAVVLLVEELNLSSLKRFDGPKYWKYGTLTLKDYRVVQRYKQSASYSREELQMFYAESTGRLPVGWKLMENTITTKEIK